MPLFVPVTITDDHVEDVADSAGLGGLDANNLSQLLLRHKETSGGLRHELIEFTVWLAKDFSS